MSTLRQAPSAGRRALAGLIGLAVLVGVVVVFSGTLTRSTDTEAQAEQMRAETARIAEQVEAGELELEFVETPDFVDWQARAIGFGQKGEQPFTLPEGAPSPRPIVPIGPQSDGQQTKAPIDAWMELLFGA